MSINYLVISELHVFSTDTTARLNFARDLLDYPSGVGFDRLLPAGYSQEPPSAQLITEPFIEQEGDVIYIRSTAPLQDIISSASRLHPRLLFIYRCLDTATETVHSCYIQNGNPFHRPLAIVSVPVHLLYEQEGVSRRVTRSGNGWVYTNPEPEDPVLLPSDDQSIQEFAEYLEHEVREATDTDPYADGIHSLAEHLHSDNTALAFLQFINIGVHFDPANYSDNEDEPAQNGNLDFLEFIPHLQLGLNDDDSESSDSSDEQQHALVTPFTDVIPEDLVCSICLNPPTNPMQTVCSHIYCQTCISPWISASRRPKCPNCRHLLTAPQ